MYVDWHKNGIARAFARAAANYERHAGLQQDSGDRLMALLGPQQGRRLLDAGCGTGWFSRRWQQQGCRVVALDLAPAMLAEARRNASASHYLAGDIERLPLANGSVDICFSNLAVQWCDDLPRALAEFYRVTRPGGLIALSTLAEGSLAELRRAWSQVDSAEHVNAFPPAETISRAFAPYRHRLTARRHTLFYPHLPALLQGLKGVGAGYVRDGRALGLTGRHRFERLAEAWERHEQGLPLSYQLLYGLIYRD